MPPCAYLSRCQPWTIVTTGVTVTFGSWGLFHTPFLTAPVAAAVALWWRIFLASSAPRAQQTPAGAVAPGAPSDCAVMGRARALTVGGETPRPLIARACRWTTQPRMQSLWRTRSGAALIGGRKLAARSARTSTPAARASSGGGGWAPVVPDDDGLWARAAPTDASGRCCHHTAVLTTERRTSVTSLFGRGNVPQRSSLHRQTKNTAQRP